ncbi:hypothetical protein [Streptomyces sp. NRRL F-2664]|uniref:hypothetical protein n=1 Tax=Streptomyces sp. NRRL F-2664 TaxID=1463842 RepID=UPI0004CC7283|nr:hypothetical protein [Streptomyces sp. NRRL F-2664]
MDAAISNLSPSERSNFILRYFHISSGVEAVIQDMRGTLAVEGRTSLAAILQQVAHGLLQVSPAEGARAASAHEGA